MNMIQGRLGGLVGKSSGYVESLPTVVRTRIHGVKGVQAEHAKLEAQFQEEILALEKKYLEKYAPLYARRAEIVAGKVEPSEAEIEVGLQDVDPDEEETREQADANDEKDIKGVPEFWLTAMKNVMSLQEMINARDEEALKSLTDIRMSYLEKPGFKLTFEFAENEFFSNRTLSKTYYYQEEAGYGGDFVYDHAEGDEIQWLEGKNLTVRYETKKQRNKNTKQTRIVKKTVPVESFFNFFNPPAVPEDDGASDVASDIDERLELDYQIGEDIKEKLIPRAVDWFTGEALAYEELDEGDFEDDNQDYDEEDESGDSEDDDSETEADGKPKQDPQECRQQ
jgi:nucleosome assembly protein 1-like 1